MLVKQGFTGHELPVQIRGPANRFRGHIVDVQVPRRHPVTDRLLFPKVVSVHEFPAKPEATVMEVIVGRCQRQRGVGAVTKKNRVEERLGHVTKTVERQHVSLVTNGEVVADMEVGFHVPLHLSRTGTFH